VLVILGAALVAAGLFVAALYFPRPARHSRPEWSVTHQPLDPALVDAGALVRLPAPTVTLVPVNGVADADR
jgi:hypothetical protein